MAFFGLLARSGGFGRPQTSRSRVSFAWRSESAMTRGSPREGGGLSIVLSTDTLEIGGLDVEDYSDLIVDQLHDMFMEEEPPKRPISKKCLAALERFNWCPSPEEDRCSICLDEYVKLDLCMRLPCGHYFHESCVEKWFEDQHNCPTCRHKLVEQSATEQAELERQTVLDEIQENILNSAAAAAACCPGCPSAFVDVADVDVEHIVRERRNAGRENNRRRNQSFQEQLFDRLINQMNSLQFRSELEMIDRVRHNR